MSRYWLLIFIWLLLLPTNEVNLQGNSEGDLQRLWGVWELATPYGGDGYLVLLPDGFASYMFVDSLTYGTYSVSNGMISIRGNAMMIGFERQVSFDLRYSWNGELLSLADSEGQLTGTLLRRFVPSDFSNCMDTIENRLFIGATGRVTFTTGQSTRLRSRPTVQAPILLEMPEGTPFFVEGTPECSDGYTWWPIRLDYRNGEVVGWVAEGSDEHRFVELLGVSLDYGRRFAETTARPAADLRAQFVGRWVLLGRLQSFATVGASVKSLLFHDGDYGVEVEVFIDADQTVTGHSPVLAPSFIEPTTFEVSYSVLYGSYTVRLDNNTLYITDLQTNRTFPYVRDDTVLNSELASVEALSQVLMLDLEPSISHSTSGRLVDQLFAVSAPLSIAPLSDQMVQQAHTYASDYLGSFEPLLDIAFVFELNEVLNQDLMRSSVEVLCFIVGEATDIEQLTTLSGERIDFVCVWAGALAGQPFAIAQVLIDPATYVDIWLDPVNEYVGRLPITCYLSYVAGSELSFCR